MGSKKLFKCTSFGGTYTKIGTIQRRLAWPLCKDDTQIREAFHIFTEIISHKLHTAFFRLFFFFFSSKSFTVYISVDCRAHFIEYIITNKEWQYIFSTLITLYIYICLESSLLLEIFSFILSQMFSFDLLLYFTNLGFIWKILQFNQPTITVFLPWKIKQTNKTFKHLQ